MKTSFSSESLAPIIAKLKPANAVIAAAYPGDADARQPVHTVYGGAQLFKANTAPRSSEVALRSVEEYGGGAKGFAKTLGIPEALADRVHERVMAKLKSQAVEDFRIDFEDGYGSRPDAEEDGHAIQAADEVKKGMDEQSLPPFIGIRIKPFTEELRQRSFRTVDLFITHLAGLTKGKLPERFVVTLPKITAPEQVAALTALLDGLEQQNGIQSGSIKIELMVETTQSIFAPDGAAALPALVAAAKGRCTGAHFGTYDYTANCSITAAHQHMRHPACDFAKHVMKVTLAGTPVQLSDGATNIMPIGPHRAAKDGAPLTAQQITENNASVHRAWKLAYDDITHSLVNGFYQGWDLHPAQLPVRYAALYTFFLGGLDSASNRLRTFLDKAAQATLVGDVFDDAATGQGLLNYFLRAINCGAMTQDECEQKTGVTKAELRSRSFVKIL
ncbi:MAG: phosphoenolpyruvate kinase, partial [Polyangia bacterium]